MVKQTELKIAKAKIEDVLRVLAAESRLLEKRKEEARIAVRDRALTEAEIDDLLPRHPAGSIAI